LGSGAVPFGLLFSVAGPYAAVSQAMLNGAMLAVGEVNARGGLRLRPVALNPAGRLERYAPLCAELLQQEIRHVVGCYTSSSRKDVIPLFERADALLWYPSHYEGFESSPNVIYTGAVANQHVLPLADYMVRRCGGRAYCIGSNYIWAWENNRILRERLNAAGGGVVAERCFTVGETDFAQVIDAIIAARPDFVFNTLIGVSSYHFLAAFRARCRARGIDQAGEIPVASCTLSEPELEAIGPEAADGHITASVYFSSIRSAANDRFVTEYEARFPGGPSACADAESAYIAVRLLAAALTEAGPEAGTEAIKRAVTGRGIDAPQGPVRISPESFHAALTPRIARSTKAMRFEILLEAPAPVEADPYLVWNSSRFWTHPAPPHRVAC
jgi:ABC-type branched-subunit amino acid transport system substrate-binding protein